MTWSVLMLKLAYRCVGVHCVWMLRRRSVKGVDLGCDWLDVWSGVCGGWL